MSDDCDWCDDSSKPAIVLLQKGGVCWLMTGSYLILRALSRINGIRMPNFQEVASNILLNKYKKNLQECIKLAKDGGYKDGSYVQPGGNVEECVTYCGFSLIESEYLKTRYDVASATLRHPIAVQFYTSKWSLIGGVDEIEIEGHAMVVTKVDDTSKYLCQFMGQRSWRCWLCYYILDGHT